MVKSIHGFNLVELMIVIAIISILVAVAQPVYQSYKVKVERDTAKTEMMEIASKLQRYRITNFNFIKNGEMVTLADINVPNAIPSDRDAMYDLRLSDITMGSWTLTAIPKVGAIVKGDGNIVLNSRGQKCWAKGSSCVPSDTTNWDGN